MTELNGVDRALLEQLQAEFPLVPQPFVTLGQSLDLSEDQVLARVRRLKDGGIIRQIGAIFDTRRLGYQSTLVAFHAEDDSVEKVAARISAHPGVSHNYARPHHYNLWFTLAVQPGHEVAGQGRLLLGDLLGPERRQPGATHIDATQGQQLTQAIGRTVPTELYDHLELCHQPIGVGLSALEDRIDEAAHDLRECRSVAGDDGSASRAQEPPGQ